MQDEAYYSSKYPTVPHPVLTSVIAYVNQHRAVGGFVRSVLENDLQRALGSADGRSLVALREIAKFVYYEVPSNCCGSSKAVAEWLGDRS
jgi:hypothetical protein